MKFGKLYVKPFMRRQTSETKFLVIIITDVPYF